MNGSRTALRSRFRRLNAAVALLLALATAVTGLAPMSGGVPSAEAQAKFYVNCCGVTAVPDVDDFRFAGYSLYYYPDHDGGRVTVQAQIVIKSTWTLNSVTFPTLFGVPGGPGEQSDEGSGVWERTYDVPAGAQDAGEKAITATATSGGKDYEASSVMSVVADGGDPTVTITSPRQSPLIVPVGKTVTIKATARDATSGIDAIEFYDGDPDDDANEPFFTDERAPFKGTFKVTAGSHVITAVAWDLVGNYAGSQAVTICGGSCDDPGPPPPTGGAPDTWDTAPMVTSLPQTFSIETRFLNEKVDNTDPQCTEDENGEPVDYDRSAWFHVRFSTDTLAYISTADSVATAGEDKPELDTVLMILTREGSGWAVWGCIDDVDYDPEGDANSVEAEIASYFYANTDYYVMAGTYYDPEDPGNDPAGTLKVAFTQP